MKIVLVGLGDAGFTIHLPALAGIPWVSIAGACDSDAARRDRAAAKFQVPVFADFDRMLAETAPDVALIATPPDTHARHCLRAIAAGAHVLCEKPFVPSLDEADRVLGAAAAAGRGVAINHEFREMPIFRALRDEAARSGAGITFVQVWQLMDLPPWAESGWRGKLTQRTLYEAGVHLVDLLMALFGEKPVSVQASTSACGGREDGVDAVALVSLEFSGGRLAHMVQNRVCKGETQYLEVRADTPAASLRASFGGRARLSAGLYRSTVPHARIDYGLSGLAWKEVGTRRTRLARNPREPLVAATRTVLRRSFEAFRTGGRPPVTGADGRDVIEVIAAAYHSAAIGRRVRLNGDLTHLASWKLGSVGRSV